MKKLSRLEIAGLLALCGDIHLVGNEDDIHFYKTPTWHNEEGEIHRVHCSARLEYEATPYYVTFQEAVEEIAASACDKYFNPTAIWYGGIPTDWKEFVMKT